MYAVGTVLAGKYRVDSILGQGGMGVVMGATHLQLGIPVALKVLHKDVAEGNGQRGLERFLREARAAAGLKSEHVCRVTDVAVMEDGTPYIVMENLVGSDLATILRTDGPMPVAAACECVLQACVALAEAHGVGIVHRDLKPANLFATRRPDGSRLVKVLDFGVAKAPATNLELTLTTTMVGSPGYMSPEQLKSSKDVDVRSDIWSLGVMLYELLTGRLPFLAESLPELILRISGQPFPPLTGMGPVGSIVDKCLEKDPASRYQNVAELANALAPFGGKRGLDLAATISGVLLGISGAPIPHTARVVVATKTGVLPRGEPVAASRSSSVALIVGIAVAIVGLGVGGMIALSGPSTQEAAPVAAPVQEEPKATDLPAAVAADAQAEAVAGPAVPVDAAVEAVAVPAISADAAVEVVEAPADAAVAEPIAQTKTTTTAKTTRKTGGTKGKTTTKTGGTSTPAPKKTTIEEVSESRR